jgi:transposase InsO family protein
MIRVYNRMKMINNIIYRITTIEDEERQQLVLPAAHIPTVLQALHDDMSNPGKDRTLSSLRDRLYWPGMYKDTESWIEQYGRCLRRKTPTNQRASLVPMATSSPLELVYMDFLTLAKSEGGYQHNLVITDHYTIYAQAIPTKNQLAKTTAEAFFNHFIVHYGIPKRIHSDQGTNFESKVIKELCQQHTGMKKSRTTSYHPMGNGMCERFNRTILNMLGSLELHQKQNWKAYLGLMIKSYNCTRHESTGQTPHLLMFRGNPRLPIDVTLGLHVEEQQTSSKCISDLK